MTERVDSRPVTNGTSITTLLAEKRYTEIEAQWADGLKEPLQNSDVLLAVAKGLARTNNQKTRLQALSGAAEAALKPKASDPAIARLRWTLLKEAVRAGATPSTTDGFHKLFEEAIRAAHPGSASLTGLLGRFKFREAKDPADGLGRIEKVEKWLPFEVGHCFSMAGRGAGKVVETNFALDSVRVDFEKAKGISVPIGVASKSLLPLPDGHFLKDKLTDPRNLAAAVLADPPGAARRLLESFGKALTMTEIKEAIQGLVLDDGWPSWWAAVKRDPHVVVHGTGKGATVEWSASVGAADDALVTKFERAGLKEKIELFKKSAKRSAELLLKLAKRLSDDAHQLRSEDPGRAFELAVLIERSTAESGLSFSARIEQLVSR